MRRSQSVRNQHRPAVMVGSDDLGVVKEDEQNLEEILRAHLLEKDKENDKLRTQIAQLKSQLAERPSLEAIDALKKEYMNLEILLDGTQRENERCMAELESRKQREKALESQLAKLAGPNWQDNLDISSTTTVPARGHTRSGSISKLQPVLDPSPSDAQPSKAFVEQVRLLVLGMEQRLQNREEKLMKSIEKAEAEGAKFEELKRHVVAQ
ncbi:uncharacterized protein PHACADRAFT_254001 [Phanerochaete carnosa HHB-10118-sp]|uniref:Uncharacterized protein n=1 Tax=Phanerochaete carnosa (strain HHB-10118-sp) TaxID=650164 RepID=K5X1Q8_PHACS|nr:uncharacterized protein PHACADRAFT_254001 [Phanerochaete carnosa HHB-10118-sp]EKM56717.1 hypothetical protein PHACADRAFT_254001 [Phanerochaete carnosa HHB-10118-sp]